MICTITGKVVREAAEIISKFTNAPLLTIGGGHSCEYTFRRCFVISDIGKNKAFSAIRKSRAVCDMNFIKDMRIARPMVEYVICVDSRAVG